MQSKIGIKEDKTGRVLSVPFWTSGRGNLAWEYNNRVYVKMKSGYTTMRQKDQNLWIAADCHTQAKLETPAEPKQDVEALRAEITQLIR